MDKKELFQKVRKFGIIYKDIITLQKYKDFIYVICKAGGKGSKLIEASIFLIRPEKKTVIDPSPWYEGMKQYPKILKYNKSKLSSLVQAMKDDIDMIYGEENTESDVFYDKKGNIRGFGKERLCELED